ncbi:ferredoxin--NADP reductase [Aliidiomarina sp. Khilg15.8]
MTQWQPATVHSIQSWHAGLFSLRIEAPEFDFKAGQFIRLGIDDAKGERLSRAYSLVNAPGDVLLEVVIAEVPDGELSPQLNRLRAGAQVWISQPASGFFTLHEVPEGDTLWMLATGTGIGPYLSMLKTELPWQRFRKIILVHGVRTQADLCYRDDLLAMQQSQPEQFVYQPVLTREPAAGALSGRIPALIDSGELEHATGAPFNDNSQVMLCGNPAMIRDARESLASKGLRKHLRRAPGHITVEQYWK